MRELTSELLARLVAGATLSRDEARDALGHVLRGEVPDVLIASFLTSLSQRGESADEMAGFVDAMLLAAETFIAPGNPMDIVGTGGDRLHSVNISTMASLTVAACGVPVAKHGNRAASSSVGTADVLEGLGVKIDLDGNGVSRCVSEAGMGFCFAQRFHPGLRHLGPIRKALGFPTAFNVLGPLANPAGVRRLMIGVANPAMIDRMAQVLALRGGARATLVRSEDGLDELSLGAVAELTIIDDEGIRKDRLDAADILKVRHDVASVRGGALDVNVGVVQDFVAGQAGPVFDVVTANAALALMAAGEETDLASGFERARAAVSSGAAATVLERLIATSNA